MSETKPNVPLETGERTAIPEVKFTDTELSAIHEDRHVLQMMADLKTQSVEEIDGMNALEYYDSNRKKDLSYIPPKKNRNDVRIVTGTTREKSSTLLSTLLNLNAEPDVTAFDQDDMVVQDAGNDMGDLIKKTRQVELWERQRPIVYREMIHQGDVFLEDTFIEEYQPQSFDSLDFNPAMDDFNEYKVEERLRRVNRMCKIRMHKQPTVLVSDPTIEYIDEQDIVAIGRKISRQHAYSIYGQWQRFKFVPYDTQNISGNASLASLISETGAYNAWTVFNTDKMEVSELKTFNVRTNRYQIYLNGVPQLPHNYQLTRLRPSGNHPLIQGKLEPISGYWLSKGIPAKTKVDQEVIDEITRLMIDGIRQSRKPPLGTTGKKVYSQNIFDPGAITTDIKEGTFHQLIPAQSLGINAAEFSFYNLIKESINEKTVNEVYSGSGDGGVDTLGQAEIMQEQQMMKLGSSLDAVMNLERSMSWARIETILYHVMTPKFQTEVLDEEDNKSLENFYETLSLETTVEDGKNGVKVFKFTDKPFPTINEQVKEEEELSEKQGRPVRISYVNPEQLRKARYKYYIIISPTPKNSDKIAVLMFVQNIKTAMEIFGPDSLNLEYLKQRYAVMINEDYSKMFQEMDIMTMMEKGMTGGLSAPTDNAADGGGQKVQLPTNAQRQPVRPVVK